MNKTLYLVILEKQATYSILLIIKIHCEALVVPSCSYEKRFIY